MTICKWCHQPLAENEVHEPTRPFYPCEVSYADAR